MSTILGKPITLGGVRGRGCTVINVEFYPSPTRW